MTRNVKLVTAIRLERNISTSRKTAGAAIANY